MNERRSRPGKDDDRGKRAGFARKTGEVRGSGSGAGGGNPGEDYDSDPMAGSGEAHTDQAEGIGRG